MQLGPRSEGSGFKAAQVSPGLSSFLGFLGVTCLWWVQKSELGMSGPAPSVTPGTGEDLLTLLLSPGRPTELGLTLFITLDGVHVTCTAGPGKRFWVPLPASDHEV